MARIRTIKPEFFTSEDIVSLSPLARLLYIATWCEADKEGRLVWKPRTMKLRYFPADDCDIEKLSQELHNAGLVVLYGEGLAYIPSFARHQHINPRETASALPSPQEQREKLTRGSRVATRHDASARDDHAQGGREGKGKEGNNLLTSFGGSGSAQIADPPTPPPDFDGTNSEVLNGKSVVALAAGWSLPEPWGIDAEALGFKPAEVIRESEKFRQFFVAGRGAGTRRSVRGWRQSWSNWLGKAAKETHR